MLDAVKTIKKTGKEPFVFVAQDIAEHIRNSSYPVISPLDEVWGSACSLQHLWVPELTSRLDKE